MLSSAFVLWSTLGRDIRRFYDPSLDQKIFETIRRYYIWGGKDAYQIRQQLRDKVAKEDKNAASSFDLPEWNRLVSFVGIIIDAPQDIFQCANTCREMSVRFASGPVEKFDTRLSSLLQTNKRIRQFTLSLAEYLISASGAPKDLIKRIEEILLSR